MLSQHVGRGGDGVRGSKWRRGPGVYRAADCLRVVSCALLKIANDVRWCTDMIVDHLPTLAIFTIDVLWPFMHAFNL